MFLAFALPRQKTKDKVCFYSCYFTAHS